MLTWMCPQCLFLYVGQLLPQQEIWFWGRCESDCKHLCLCVCVRESESNVPNICPEWIFSLLAVPRTWLSPGLSVWLSCLRCCSGSPALNLGPRRPRGDQQQLGTCSLLPTAGPGLELACSHTPRLRRTGQDRSWTEMQSSPVFGVQPKPGTITWWLHAKEEGEDTGSGPNTSLSIKNQLGRTTEEDTEKVSPAVHKQSTQMDGGWMDR